MQWRKPSPTPTFVVALHLGDDVRDLRVAQHLRRSLAGYTSSCKLQKSILKLQWSECSKRAVLIELVVREGGEEGGKAGLMTPRWSR